MNSTLFFTPGPVPMSVDTLRIVSKQLPYFRNAEFSEVVLECEQMLLQLTGAPSGSRALLITASGTAAMEATVINLLSPADKALVINGGSFGQRFCDICTVHAIPYDELKIDVSDILVYPESDAKALLINGHETSQGRCYDIHESGSYCHHNGIIHVVDGISLFVTDEIHMENQNIDVLILSSHKGLALPPGLCMVLLAPIALASLRKQVNTLYFDFHRYLADGERGQTPFTPAIGIILALQQRLKQIQSDSIDYHIAKAHALAEHFRSGIRSLPLRLHAATVPNAMTALERTDGGNALELVYAILENDGITLTPNGGELTKKVFRVSHMGEQSHEDVDHLLVALHRYFGV